MTNKHKKDSRRNLTFGIVSLSKPFLCFSFFFIFLFFFLLSSVSAFNFPSDGTTVDLRTGNLTNFTGLQDTPSSYSGQGGKFAKVNAGETALEFTTGSADLTPYSTLSYLNTNYYNITDADLINASNNNYILYTNETMKEYVDGLMGFDLGNYVTLTYLTSAHYNKSEVEAILGNTTFVLADVLNNGTYIQDLAPYSTLSYLTGAHYNKTEIDASLADYSTLSYLTGAHYNKTELQNIINNGTYIQDLSPYSTLSYLTSAHYNKTETDATLLGYPTWAKLEAGTYNKTEVDNLLGDSFTWATLWEQVYNETEIDAELLKYPTFTKLYANVYNETEVDTALADYSTLSYLTSTHYNKTEIGLVNTSMKNYVDSIDTEMDWTTIWEQIYNETEIETILSNGTYTYDLTPYSTLTYLTSAHYNKTETEDILANGTFIGGSGTGAISGAGTFGYIPMWNGTHELNNSVVYQNGSNVGIGTTSPTAKLQVNHVGDTANAIQIGDIDTATSNTGIYLRTTNNASISTGTNSNLYFRSGGFAGVINMVIQGNSGNVGIGTTTPDEKLSIMIDGENNSKPAVNFYSTVQSGANTIGYDSGKIYSQFDKDIFSGARLTFATPTGVGAYEDVMTLKDGNVGIGTTSPQNELNVVGDINATGLIYGNGSQLTGIAGTQITNDLNWINASTANGSYVPYTGADSNINLGSQNITTTGTGFFGFLGNLTSRISGLFVNNVDVSNNLSVGENLSVGGNLDVEGDVYVEGFVYSDVCPEGMAYINKVGGYCIDKYEASMPGATSSVMGTADEMDNRNNPGSMKAESKAGVIPWVKVSQVSARTACENAGKNLCSDAEWLGAANVQGQTYYLPNSLSVAPYYCVVDSGTYCTDNSYESGEACDTGTYSGGASGCYSKEGVYDMTGNVWEWTDELVDVTNPDGVAGWKYANQEGEWQTSTSGLWNKYGEDGVYFPTSTTARAVLRGGTWNYGAIAGPFCASLADAPTLTAFYIGFRCCSASS